MTEQETIREWNILIGLFRSTVEQTNMLTGETQREAKMIFNRWTKEGNKLVDLIEKERVKRGLITHQTTKEDFLNKLFEEVGEFEEVFVEHGMIDAEELADIILVCLNIAKHYKIDIEKEMRGKIAVNFNRAANGR